MNQSDTSFFISKENFANALKAVQKLQGDYAWIRPGFQKLQSLSEILQEWRWMPKFDQDGNINDLTFDGGKLGDDRILFGAIAPYVQNDSFIIMNGEDGEQWKWLFSEGKLKTGQRSYEFEF